MATEYVEGYIATAEEDARELNIPSLADLRERTMKVEQHARELERYLAEHDFDASEDARARISEARERLRWAGEDLELAEQQYRPFLVVESALGDALALAKDEDDAARWAQAAEQWYGEAAAAHRLGAPWVNERTPVRIRRISATERDAILDEGTPILQREP